MSGSPEPLILASMSGRVEEVQGLLQGALVHLDGADVHGRIALIAASSGGYGAIVQMLLDRGANVNVADVGDGKTALMLASNAASSAGLKPAAAAAAALGLMAPL